MPLEYVEPTILYSDDDLTITPSYGDDNLIDDEDYTTLRVYHETCDMDDEDYYYEFDIKQINIKYTNFGEFKELLAISVEDGYITPDGIVLEPQNNRFTPDTLTGNLFAEDELEN